MKSAFLIFSGLFLLFSCKGPQGLPGRTGLNGLDGSNGTQGNRGLTGDAGAPGNGFPETCKATIYRQRWLLISCGSAFDRRSIKLRLRRWQQDDDSSSED